MRSHQYGYEKKSTFSHSIAFWMYLMNSPYLRTVFHSARLINAGLSASSGSGSELGTDDSVSASTSNIVGKSWNDGPNNHTSTRRIISSRSMRRSVRLS